MTWDPILQCMMQVNAALEDAAELAEANKRMLIQAKVGAKMPTLEWKRAQTLLINIAVRIFMKSTRHVTGMSGRAF